MGVLRFEVKMEKEVNCSGAYLKLLTGKHAPNNFNDQTPFSILFGPDRCGSKDQVQ